MKKTREWKSFFYWCRDCERKVPATHSSKHKHHNVVKIHKDKTR